MKWLNRPNLRSSGSQSIEEDMLGPGFQPPAGKQRTSSNSAAAPLQPSYAAAAAADGHCSSTPAAVTGSSAAAGDDQMLLPEAGPLSPDLHAFCVSAYDSVLSELQGLLPAVLQRAAGSAARQLQQQISSSAQQTAQLQQLLQAKEDALSTALTKHQTTCSALSDTQARLHSTEAELCSSRTECSKLKEALETGKKQCQGLQDKLQVKYTELAALNVELDNTQADLEDANCRGKELLTYQGLSCAGATLDSLNQALKQLNDAKTSLVTCLLAPGRVADVIAPTAYDLPGISKDKGKLQQLRMHALGHTVLGEVARLVFGAFRAASLTIEVGASPSDEAADDNTLLLQLLLEKKKAAGWLQVVSASSSSSSSSSSNDSKHGQYFQEKVVNKVAVELVRGLIHSKAVLWGPEAQANMHSVGNNLLPVARQVAAAAIKAQVICSCMHTRLVQLHVPGWQQPEMADATLGDAAPKAWSCWPGIAPLTGACMQMGAVLPAADVLLPAVTAAAVYCMDPAVIHVVERMGQLAGHVPGAALPQPFKVIRKAKMCVAKGGR